MEATRSKETPIMPVQPIDPRKAQRYQPHWTRVIFRSIAFVTEFLGFCLTLAVGTQGLRLFFWQIGPVGLTAVGVGVCLERTRTASNLRIDSRFYDMGHLGVHYTMR